MTPNSASPTPMSVLRFAGCELRPATRELWRDGALQHVEPKVFDVLAYLVMHHDRVIGCDELLDAVWHTQHVSDSVVARCIMKARRAIGDAASPAQWIRTVHRSGYRFVNNEQALALPFRPPVPSAAALRIAVLPFRNRSADPALVWVELGLPELVNRTLEAQHGLAPVPLLEILGVLGAEAQQRGVAESAGMLQERLGSVAVLAFEVHAAAPTPRQLSWALHRDGVETRCGHAGGAVLTELAIGTAQKIARELASSQAAPETWPFGGDPFLTEVFARGMEAMAQQRFRIALHHLQLCVDAEPHPIEADAEQLLLLALVCDPSIEERAGPVQQRAAAAGRIDIQVQVQRALSIHCLGQGDRAGALNAVEQGLHLLGDTDGSAEASLPLGIALMRKARLAFADRAFDTARGLVERVAAIGLSVRSERLTALALVAQAQLAQMHGDLDVALPALRRAAELNRAQHSRNADLCDTLMRWAALCADLGRLREAAALIDEAVLCALHVGWPPRAAEALLMQVSIACFAGLPDVAQAALAQLRGHARAGHRSSVVLLQVAESTIAWHVGDLPQALAHQRAAEPLLRPYWFYRADFALALRAGLAIEAGQFGVAQAAIDELRAHPHFSADPWQQSQVLLLRAALSHAQGARGQAWMWLRRALARAPRGAVRSRAALAAVWLACEDGQSASSGGSATQRAWREVPAWLAEAGAWLDEHPFGMTARARWCFANGDLAGAVSGQARYVEGWPAAEVGPVQRELLKVYRASMRCGRPLPVAALKVLPTLRF